jgi:hypothetical protein
LKISKDVADQKVVCMNLMRSNVSITDRIYGALSTADVGQRIAGLGKQLETEGESQDAVANQLIKVAMLLKRGTK